MSVYVSEPLSERVGRHVTERDDVASVHVLVCKSTYMCNREGSSVCV